MQKLDFTKNIQFIAEKLLSRKIVGLFNEGFRNPGSAFNYGQITNLLFSSKSNFDEMSKDPILVKILENINAHELYSPQSLAQMTNTLKNSGASSIIGDYLTLKFYLAHSALLNAFELTEGVLFEDDLLKNTNNETSDGLILFEIIIEDESLDASKYIRIFKLLSELINATQKIPAEEEKIDVVLLDSGSNTNLGLQVGLDTAKSAFLIFKEVWEWMVNKDYYKNKKNNEALFESLSMRSIIQEKLEAGVISEVEAKAYQHLIKTRAEDLIGLGVLPKQLVTETTEDIGHKRMLKEISEIKLLKSGE